MSYLCTNGLMEGGGAPCIKLQRNTVLQTSCNRNEWDPQTCFSREINVTRPSLPPTWKATSCCPQSHLLHTLYHAHNPYALKVMPLTRRDCVRNY
ncbi:hypothetical protein FKM82_008171 [Ascaphus truei]